MVCGAAALAVVGLPVLAGIDPALAMRQRGGNAAFYPRLLQQWALHCGGLLPSLQGLAGQGDDTAQRAMAHSVRGAAGAIGAIGAIGAAALVQQAPLIESALDGFDHGRTLLALRPLRAASGLACARMRTVRLVRPVIPRLALCHPTEARPWCGCPWHNS